MVFYRASFDKKSLKAIAITFLIFLTGCFSFAFSPYKNIAGFLFDAQFYVFFIVFTLLFTTFNFDNIEFEKLFITAILWSLFIFLLDCALLIGSGGGLFFYDVGIYRLSPGLGPSAGSIYLLAALIPMLCFPWEKSNRLRIFICALITIMIVATGTRITMIAMVAMGFYLLWRKGRIGLNKEGFSLGILACLVAYSVMQRLFFGGGTNGLEAVNTNGRLEIWLGLLKAGLDSYISGNGFGASYSYITSTGIGRGIGTQPHNDYIRIFFNTGIIGIGLFLLLSIILWKASGKGHSSPPHNNISIAAQMYLIGLFILMTTDNVIIYHFYIYPCLMTVSYCITKKNRPAQCL